jgi:hypothetical protein
MKAEKLLQRMRQTLAGWGQDHFDTLYRGYGFECEEGSNHHLYFHPEYPELMATVGRHNKLHKGYASHAIETIDRLIELEKTKDDGH